MLKTSLFPIKFDTVKGFITIDLLKEERVDDAKNFLLKNFENSLDKIKEDKEKLINSITDLDNNTFILATNPLQEIIGMACLNNIYKKDKHSLWEIRYFYVDQEHRNTGAGAHLIHSIEVLIREYLKKTNLESAKLIRYVVDGKSDSLSFFELLGYNQEGILTDYFAIGHSFFLFSKLITKQEK